jgi:hypothetical protein
MDRDCSHPVRLSHQKNRYHTLVADDQQLYLLDTNRLECCDHSGGRLWHFACRSFALPARLSLYGEETLLLTLSGARNVLLCLSRKSGRLLWSLDLQGLPCALAGGVGQDLYDLYTIQLEGAQPQLRRQRLRRNQVLEQVDLPRTVTSVRGYAHGASHVEGERVYLQDFAAGLLGSFSLGGRLVAECWNPHLQSYAWIEMAQGRSFLTRVCYPTTSIDQERSPKCSSSYISYDTQATA